MKIGPARPDPDAPNWPVNDRLVNARRVTIEAVCVNSARAWTAALRAAVEEFGRYVAGEVRVLAADPVTLPTDADGWLTRKQLDALMDGRSHRRPSDITVYVFGPPIRDLPHRHFCMPLRDGSHVIVFQRSRRAGRRPRLWLRLLAWPFALLVRRVTSQRWLILHELCHALRVPSDRSHAMADAHCTRPECILHGGPDARGLLWVICHLGPPRRLCELCRQEIRRARQAAAGRLIDPDEPYDGMERLDEMVRLNPDRPLEYMYRAQEHVKRKDYQKAVDDYTRAIELDPRDRTVMCCRNRGVAMAHLGRYDGAAGDWQRCLDLKADDTLALCNLAWLLSCCEQDGVRDGARAVGLAERACELTGWKRPRMLDVLAAAYAETGRFEKAIEQQQAAISLAGEKQAEQFRRHLRLYEAGSPRRDPRENW